MNRTNYERQLERNRLISSSTALDDIGNKAFKPKPVPGVDPDLDKRINDLIELINKSNKANDKILDEINMISEGKFTSKANRTNALIYPDTPHNMLYDEISKDLVDNIPIKASNKLDKALKFDDGKVDWSILPLTALEEIIKVLKFGEKKYGRGNFASNGGLEYTRLINALLRHTTAFARGEDIDPETGLSHIAHAGCCALFLLHSITHSDACNKDDRRDNILR